jgi:hypothetical protein
MNNQHRRIQWLLAPQYGSIGHMKPNARNTLPSLEQLEKIDGCELRNIITQAGFGEIPQNASARFLRGHLAWSIQALESGHNSSALRKSLIGSLRKARRVKVPLYKPGTRLIREWQGVTHEVTIEEKGFTWNGKRYGNLSRIASAITGTHWSGPRFFGINEKS